LLGDDLTRGAGGSSFIVVDDRPRLPVELVNARTS